MRARIKKGFRYLQEFSAFLLVGTVVALVWANVDYESYHHFIDDYLFHSSLLEHGGSDGVSLHFLINDVFMALFFGIAGKEVAESFLPGGALSSIKKAAMPVVATAGGVIGPILTFLALAFVLGVEAEVITAAWAIPTATDIAYCWLFAGLIFGRAHPAVTFLLVLAVLDDLIGMLIIATYYTPEVHVGWLGLVVLGIALCEGMRRWGVTSFWPYLLIGGTLSWFGLLYTGVHAALALVPIVPFMPHSHRDEGLFVEHEGDEPGTIDHDTMNNFEHFFKPIVDVGLFMFGLANAGVALSAGAFAGAVTWTIFLALLVGKTVGISAFSWVGQRFGLTLPEHMNQKQTVVLGCVAGIGFTVALFVTAVAVDLVGLPTETADMLKLGALLSFVAGPLAWMMAKALGIKKIVGPETAVADADDMEPQHDTRDAAQVSH